MNILSDVLQYILGLIVIAFANLYISSKILRQAISWKKYNIYVAILIYAFILLLTYTQIDHFFKVVFNYLGLIACNIIVSKNNFSKITIASLITFGILAFSEILYTSFVVNVIGANLEEIKYKYFASFFSNLCISVIGMTIIRINRVNVFFNEKVCNISKKNIKPIMTLSVVTVLFLSLILYSIYFKMDFKKSIIMGIMLIIIFWFILLKLFTEINENIRVQDKYKNLENYLSHYQKMLFSQKMINHKNDNNLLVIRGLVHDSDAIHFIDSLMVEKRQEDQDILNQALMIPTVELQGLVYYKLLNMKAKKINFDVQVSSNIESFNLNLLDGNTHKNICTVIGVFLDNAIEAVENINRKMIGINLYTIDHYFVIEVSNSYNGILEVEKFDEAGYTTKDDDHGFGLSLVKEIIENDVNLENERNINGCIIKHLLKIRR